METGTVTGTTGTSSTSGKTASTNMDKDAFLKLLVAQLEHQDPTTSQDPNTMVQQMTSFSMLESSQNTNTLLAAIQGQNTGLFQSQAVGLVGKKVQVSSSTYELHSGKASAGVDVAADAADVVLKIKDAKGNVVRTLDAGAMKTGSHVVDWDGKDDAGKSLEDGSYTIEVAATDKNGATVRSQASAYVTVDSISFESGTVYLACGGKRFPISDINGVTA